MPKKRITLIAVALHFYAAISAHAQVRHCANRRSRFRHASRDACHRTCEDARREDRGTFPRDRGPHNSIEFGCWITMAT